MKKLCILVFSLVSLAAAQAPLNQATAEQIRVAIKPLNLRLETATDPYGDPLLRFGYKVAKVHLYFFECNQSKPKICKSLQLYAGFAMKQKPTWAMINEWNQEYRYGRAYLDSEGDPVLEADLSLEGGITPGALQKWVSNYLQLLEAFFKAMNIAVK